MFNWLGNFLETLADRAPDIPRPFNGLWEALGRGDEPPTQAQPPSE